IVNAVDGQGRFLGSVVTESKSNEIPAARELLRRQDLEGKILVADAKHTNDETGRQILFEGGGDYLLTVKGNQSTWESTLAKLFEKQSFWPSGQLQDARVEAGAQPQPAGDSVSGVRGSDSQPSELSGSPLGGSVRNARQTQRPMVP